MFLKNKIFLFFFVFTIFFFHKVCLANTQKINDIVDYLSSLKFFSSSFIQDDRETLSEGKIFVGEKRIRVDYTKPSKILIILDKDKAMYYNYDLDEDEFFNPKDTNAWFFFDIFKEPNFFLESLVVSKNNNLLLTKTGENEIGSYKLKIYFENKPLILRKIELEINDTFLNLSIFDHKFNEEYDENFFKLINPTFFN